MHFTTLTLAAFACLAAAKDTWQVSGGATYNVTTGECLREIAKEHGQRPEKNCRKTDNGTPAQCFTYQLFDLKTKYNLTLFTDENCQTDKSILVMQNAQGDIAVAQDANGALVGKPWKSFRIDAN